jgi:hypothetical protein
MRTLVVSAIFCLFQADGTVWGQAGSAQITGLVTDSSGSGVPAAQIVVTSEETLSKRETVSNQFGNYAIPLLPPGRYQINVRKDGFKPVSATGVRLDVAQVARMDFSLEVGQVTESVTVTTAAPLLEAGSATLSSVVANKQIVDLPLNGRNILSLMRLTPGVTPSLPNTQDDFFTNAHRFTMNGSRESTSEILLDGVSALVQSDHSGIYGTATLPSVDGVQEFRIQTNVYSSEYGRSGGGVVTMVSKSGSNEFHGSVFEFLRNSVMDANNFFANRSGIKLASVKRNEFGGSIGGPIWKNHTFFFGLYQGTRLSQAAFQSFTVPTLLERQGDFSDSKHSDGRLKVIFDPSTTRPNPDAPGRFVRTPFAGNLIPPDRLDPVALRTIAFYPQPNAAGRPFTRQDNFVAQGALTRPVDRFEAKIDHEFNPSRRIFSRYSYFTTDYMHSPNYWGNEAVPSDGIMYYHSHSGVIDYTESIGNRTVLNLRYGGTKFFAWRPTYGYGFDVTELGWPASIQQVSDASRFPLIQVQDYSSMGGSRGSTYRSANTTHVVDANLFRITGRHSTKFGVSFRTYLLNFFQLLHSPGTFNFSRTMTQGPDPYVASVTSGVGTASFLLGAGDSGEMNKNPQPALANHYFGFYVQNDTKWSRNLTINLGLRWELETGAKERYDRLTGIDPFVRNPLSDKVGRDIFGGYLYAGGTLGRRTIRDLEMSKFSPRVGLSYQLGSRTVLRTGYGIFFGVPPYAPSQYFSGAPYQSITPWVATLDSITPYRSFANPFPEGFNLPPGKDAGLLGGVGFHLRSGWPETLRTMYNQQWNFTVQRSIGSSTVWEVAYAGNKGTRLPIANNVLWRIPNMNQLRPELIRPENRLLDLVPNPFYGSIQGGILGQPVIQRGQLLRPFPQFDVVIPLVAGWANSNYHSLQSRFERRFSNGTSFTASYTWSKTISDSADGFWNDIANGEGQYLRDWYCRTCDRSLSSYDQPHRFVANFVYELPFGRGKWLGSGWNAFVDGVLGGWQVNGILTLASGRPLRILQAQETSRSFGGGQRPDSTGVNADLGDEKTIDRWFDTRQFTVAREYTFGNLARTHPNLRSDPTKTIDLSMFKSVNITERLNIQFRAEAFNLTNTPIFAPPNTTVGSGSFGAVTSQDNAPRQIQLGLKLLF